MDGKSEKRTNWKLFENFFVLTKMFVGKVQIQFPIAVWKILASFAELKNVQKGDIRNIFPQSEFFFAKICIKQFLSNICK